MKCLVTGSAGFIGNALVKRLVKEGHDVKALIHDSKLKFFEEKVEYIKGDITNFDSIRTIAKDVDVVFHCAAFVKDFGSKELFRKINYEGTKNLVKSCINGNIYRFVFISHLRYESEKKVGHYFESKFMAEQFLLESYKINKFPVVIIRPGNVYGPGATTWVLRPLKSIQKNRIALIEQGNGIFLHTYIDNLIDALILTMNVPKIEGKTIDITDGDNSITWGKYLNDLAKIAKQAPIKKNVSKKTALIIGNLMLFVNKVFRTEPWVTPVAVSILTNNKKVSIDKAEKLLGYKPIISYNKGIENIKKWLHKYYNI